MTAIQRCWTPHTIRVELGRLYKSERNKKRAAMDTVLNRAAWSQPYMKANVLWSVWNKQPFHIFLYFPVLLLLQWGDETPSAAVKPSPRFYSWLSITCRVHTPMNTCFPLIINQWSIKQAICPIRAGGPSRPRMAYLAVWLERSGGNGYACIMDQNQVFKHLSHLSRSVRPFGFPSRTSHRRWKTRVQ